MGGKDFPQQSQKNSNSKRLIVELSANRFVTDLSTVDLLPIFYFNYILREKPSLEQATSAAKRANFRATMGGLPSLRYQR